MASTKSNANASEATTNEAPVEETMSKADYDKLAAEYNKVVAAMNKLLKEYNELHIQALFAEEGK